MFTSISYRPVHISLQSDRKRVGVGCVLTTLHTRTPYSNHCGQYGERECYGVEAQRFPASVRVGGASAEDVAAGQSMSHLSKPSLRAPAAARGAGRGHRHRGYVGQDIQRGSPQRPSACTLDNLTLSIGSPVPCTTLSRLAATTVFLTSACQQCELRTIEATNTMLICN
jgi:hypothetical protein